MLQDTLDAELMAGHGQWHRVAHWNYTERDLETFQRFQQRTVATIGTSHGAPVYLTNVGPLAFMVRLLFWSPSPLSINHIKLFAPTAGLVADKH